MLYEVITTTEDHIFKCLALGAPYVKAVCMGRASYNFV